MNITFLILGSIALLAGCATEERTQYGPNDSPEGGYSEENVTDHVARARFTANANTTVRLARLLSAFRAQEICDDEGFKFARIVGERNHSTSKTVRKTASYGYTSQVNSTGNVYVNGNNATLYSQSNGGDTFGSSTSWNETYTYPVYDTFFRCANEVRVIQAQLRIVPGEEIKDYAKDLLAAPQVTDMPDNSVNKGRIQVGDIILKVDNKRTTNFDQFTTALDRTADPTKVPMLIVREGNKVTVNVATVDASQDFEDTKFEIVSSACRLSDVSDRPLCKSVTPDSRASGVSKQDSGTGRH